MAKNKVGPVAVYMSKELLNGMLHCLDYIIASNDGGDWSISAARIKAKILKYGRKFESQGDESVAVHFYEKEAAVLLKAFSLFVFLTQKRLTDYFGQIINPKENAKENA